MPVQLETTLAHRSFRGSSQQNPIKAVPVPRWRNTVAGSSFIVFVSLTKKELYVSICQAKQQKESLKMVECKCLLYHVPSRVNIFAKPARLQIGRPSMVWVSRLVGTTDIPKKKFGESQVNFCEAGWIQWLILFWKFCSLIAYPEVILLSWPLSELQHLSWELFPSIFSWLGR